MFGPRPALLALTLIGLGCRSGKITTGEPPEDTGSWWPAESVEDEDGAYDWSDLDEDDEELEDCPADFDPDSPCDGDWTETICLYAGLIWWCEDGAWWNEETDPDEDDA